MNFRSATNYHNGKQSNDESSVIANAFYDIILSNNVKINFLLKYKLSYFKNSTSITSVTRMILITIL